MPPLDFSDEELETITALASPLPPSARSSFLQLIANKLGAYPPGERGPGLTHRVALEAQRDFLKNGPIAIGIASKFRRGKYE